MGEKGNVVDPASAASAAQVSRNVVADATGAVSATVVQTADSLRDKAVTTAVDHTIDEARDRLRQRGSRPGEVAPPGEDQPEPPGNPQL